MADSFATGRYPQQVPIDAYGNGGFRFAELSHKGSLLCLPTGMFAWEPKLGSEVTLKALAPVLEVADQLDVLLVGTGDDMIFLDPEIRQAFRERKVIIEPAATGGAVRTYNVLLAEERAVGAALVAVERGK